MPEKNRTGKTDVKTLTINGVAMTATAAQLNTVGAVATQLNTVAGVSTQLNTVAAAAGTVAFDRIVKVDRVALAAVDTAGGCFAWANPEGASILIERVVIDVTTKSTGAGTLSVGTAANGTTSSANLIDTLDVGTAAGTFDNLTDGGTLGKSRQKLTSGQSVTGSKASGALAGLVGFAYIHYFLP
jgi:hypothetical protein